MRAWLLLCSGALATEQTAEDPDCVLSLLALRSAKSLKSARTGDWFDDWWAERSQFREPETAADCQAASVRFDGFFGSQIFKDLKILASHATPIVRYLDVATCPYTQTSLDPRDTDSAALASLRTCLRDRASGNAIGCLFAPLSTCSADRPPASAEASNSPELGKEISREAALCAGAGDPCVAELRRAVPISPRLEGATGEPDVSSLALQLFARLTAPVPDLQRAVDEEVAKFRSEHSEMEAGKCVALHVRRGDKLPECGQGKETSCAFHKTFDEYLEPATAFLDQLQGGYVFVMTDDPSLLEQEKRSDGGYRVVGLSGTTPTDFAHADGLQDLITLLASLEIGSACEAVVGNSESEVTELLVLANCAKRGSCPSVHSMNGRPLQAFEGVIVDGRASTVRDDLEKIAGAKAD